MFTACFIYQSFQLIKELLYVENFDSLRKEYQYEKYKIQQALRIRMT